MDYRFNQIQKKLSLNEPVLRDMFHHCDDFSFRHFQIGGRQGALLVFFGNLIKKDFIDDIILRDLLHGLRAKGSVTIEGLQDQLVSASEVHEVATFGNIEEQVVFGNAVLLVDGLASGLAIGALGWEHRGIEKSENEVSLRGSQQAFTENMMNNIALTRRFVFNARLKVEKGVLGTITKTPYCLTYIDGIADSNIINEVKIRLQRVKIDQVLDTGYIEELIRDTPWSPFPTINHTERPDRVAAQLLEGRVALFLENAPTIITMPAIFIEFLQVPEDYYENFLLQSAVRMLRYTAFTVSLVLPSIYVAILAFHHELIPNSFLSSMISQRAEVPLPTVIEVFIMEGVFEVLREAGLRLPRAIGQAVSIVGALVIGQAAVQARLVMASTVIVVASTGICSFTVPGFSMAASTRLLRFPLLLITGLFGLLGFIIGTMIIGTHLLTLKSFGVPYMGGFAPGRPQDLKDSIVRAPFQAVWSRTSWMGRRRR